MATWITDFTIYISNDAGCPPQINEYEMHLQDLNEGSGGKYVYAGCKSERISGNHDDAVTSLSFLAFSSQQTQKPDGWQFWNPQDLNVDAGGKFIYIVWNKGEETDPIIEIDFVVNESNDSIDKKGISWTKINQDLNEGAGGKYIFCSYFRGHALDDQIFKRFKWEIRGKLARSSAPHYNEEEGDKSQKMDDDAIKFLVKNDIKNVISLNEFILNKEEIEKLREHNIDYLHLPVDDFTAPTIDQLREAYASYKQALTTLVYCGYGHGRTGTVIAAFSLIGHRYTYAQYHELFYVEQEEQYEVLDRLAEEL
ncbi:24698_t:CDS:1 [Dentiscutata erythropus]|uniref:24698_t:CDS:1 n=1 Tax=Dentiscutata erythropus TaxID=1348616 RepID=A0A9N9CJX4_9GLOM|nr:24698_t:CDS:1 [Dentiscutata erythropus]